MLLFKKRFLPAIRSGDKTQTVRLWKHRRMKAGQKSYIPGVGHIRIETVDEVSLDELTEGDARRDGFPSADALRAELRSLYDGQQQASYRAYRVTFRLERATAKAATSATSHGGPDGSDGSDPAGKGGGDV